MTTLQFDDKLVEALAEFIWTDDTEDLRPGILAQSWDNETDYVRTSYHDMAVKILTFLSSKGMVVRGEDGSYSPISQRSGEPQQSDRSAPSETSEG